MEEDIPQTIALLAVAATEPKGGGQRMEEWSAPLRVKMHPASPLKLPGQVDSNSPAHWDGEALYVFTSAGHPYRSVGRDLFSLGDPQPVRFNNQVNGGRWIESTWRAKDGTLYGWYHFEPFGVCPGTTLTSPQIGALRSHDNGATWQDLGIVLKAPDETIDCTAQNGYFAGGARRFLRCSGRSRGVALLLFRQLWRRSPNARCLCRPHVLARPRCPHRQGMEVA